MCPGDWAKLIVASVKRHVPMLVIVIEYTPLIEPSGLCQADVGTMVTSNEHDAGAEVGAEVGGGELTHVSGQTVP